MFSQVESIEMSNNVIYNADATSPNVYRAVSPGEVQWASGSPQVSGQDNWVETGATSLPPGWTGTVTGTDASPAGPAGFAFPQPLFPPAFVPPRVATLSSQRFRRRFADGLIDIGAYERVWPRP
jgi:hypothetical protein